MHVRAHDNEHRKVRRVSSRKRDGKGGASRDPVEARSWAVGYANRWLSNNRALTTIAARLSVSDMTLRARLHAHMRKPAGELCEVVVAEPETGRAGRKVEHSRPITLSTVDGPVVSGLDLQGAAALLRAPG